MKMDLALNNVQRSLWHKTHKPTNLYIYIYICVCLCVCVYVCVCVSKRVCNPVALLRSITGKYPWERYQPPLSSQQWGK